MCSFLKGWLGEKKTQLGLWRNLGKEYIRFHNVIVPTSDGTTQIDHILLSRYGIFVVETKNKDGWIFGDEKARQWTQVLYKKKYKFQNPLHQNYRHTKALSSYLKIDHSRIHSIVFFIGNKSELKTSLPSNVMTSGLSGYIKKFQTTIFSSSELEAYQRMLEGLKNLNISNREHVANLRSRFSSYTTCPKCGGELVKRTARRGRSAGKSFLGCSSYPKCQYTRNFK